MDTFERHSEYSRGDRVELAPWLDGSLRGGGYGTFLRDAHNPAYVLVAPDGVAESLDMARLIPRTAVRRVDE